MALLVAQHQSPAGLDISFVAADIFGDQFPNTTSNTGLMVKNDDVADTSLTFQSPNECSFGKISPVHDMIVVVPAGSFRFIGPFEPSRFNDINWRVGVSYSSVVNLSVACIVP
jgi:hypothetical protein